MQQVLNPRTISRRELWDTGTSSRRLKTEKGVGFVVQTIVELNPGEPNKARPHVVTVAKQPGRQHEITAFAQPVMFWKDPYGPDYRCYPYGSQIDVDVDFAVAALQQRLPNANTEAALSQVAKVGKARID